MAASRRQQERVRKARELYVRGMERDAIAQALGVSNGAVTLWQNREKRNGVDWDAERERARSHRPDAVLDLLEERLAKLIVDEAPTSGAGAEAFKEHETRLLNAIKIIQGYRETTGGVELQLRALERFAEFCASHVAPEQLGAVREAVEKFADDLRRQCE